jgi:hypothetical protein
MDKHEQQTSSEHPNDERLHSFRLSPQADALLRKNAPRRGAIKQRILTALQQVDMSALKGLEHQRKAGPSQQSNAPTYLSTTITMPESAYERLKNEAKGKGVSVTVLVDACILTYYTDVRPA